MTRERAIACAAAAAALAAAAVPARADTVKKLRFERVSPAGSALAKGLDAVAAEVKAKTKGALIIEWVQRPATDNASMFYGKIYKGTLDGAELDASGLSQIFPAATLLAVPYADTAARAEYVADQFWSQLVVSKNFTGQFVLSSLRAATPLHLFANASAIPRNDNGRAACLVEGSDPTESWLESVTSKAQEALRLDQVGAKLASAPSAGANSLLCFGAYATATSLRWAPRSYSTKVVGYALEAVVIGKKTFDGLPAAQQKILLDALNDTAQLRVAVHAEDDRAARSFRNANNAPSDDVDWQQVSNTRADPCDCTKGQRDQVVKLAADAAKNVK